MLTKGFWIHDRFMDVFIEVFTYEGKHSGQDVYTIEWWNRGQTPGNYFPIGERDMIGLDPEDYQHWKMYDPATRASMEPLKSEAHVIEQTDGREK